MLNQAGPVWFLAGTDGTDRVTRQCTVPLGKYLFLPVITMIGNSLPGKAKTCAEAKAFAAANNEHLARAEVEIDGKRIEGIPALRIASRECFDAYPVAPYLTNPRSYYPAATDGYWLMLAPLSAGAHTIKVEARYDNPGDELGDLEQEFEYELRVAPEDEPKQAAPKAFEGLIVGQRVPVPELT